VLDRSTHHRVYAAVAGTIRRAERASPDESRNEATRQWRAATPASQDHRYLELHRLPVHGLRQSEARLLAPIFDGAGLCAVQRTGRSGERAIIGDLSRAGAYIPVGSATGTDAPIVVCTSWEEGAALHEASDMPVWCSLTDDNVPHVLRAVRARFPDRRLLVCAGGAQEASPALIKTSVATRAGWTHPAMPQAPR
jgi:putative DNA primase/helicase